MYILPQICAHALSLFGEEENRLERHYAINYCIVLQDVLDLGQGGY